VISFTDVGLPANIAPGDFAVVSAGGDVGRAIRALQWANGDGYEDYEHALIYIGGPEHLILEAAPGGSRIRPMSPRAHAMWSTGVVDIPDASRARVPFIAPQFEHIPYSALDYGALTAHRLHVPDLPIWPPHGKGVLPVTLRTYIEDGGHLICSQLVDRFELALDVHLFGPGTGPGPHWGPERWAGFVTPGTLTHLLLALGAKPMSAVRP
jgi:hypothetical protein